MRTSFSHKVYYSIAFNGKKENSLATGKRVTVHILSVGYVADCGYNYNLRDQVLPEENIYMMILRFEKPTKTHNCR